MGRSRMIRFIIKIKLASGAYNTPMEWRVRRNGVIPADGTPNAANVDKWVKVFEASLQPGGCNAHCGPDKVTAVSIIDQKIGEIVYSDIR